MPVCRILKYFAPYLTMAKNGQKYTSQLNCIVNELSRLFFLPKLLLVDLFGCFI